MSMRLYYLLLALLTVSCNNAHSQPKRRLDYVLETKHEPSAELRQQVEKYREDFITLALQGRHIQGDIPCLLTQHAIDSLRQTPIYVVNMDSLDHDVLAMYVVEKGQSTILLSERSLNYGEQFEDIVVHEYIHEVDKMLGDRVKDMPRDTLYSQLTNFSGKVLRDSLDDRTAFIEQGQQILLMSALVHSTNGEDMLRNYNILRDATLSNMKEVWYQSNYYQSSGETFTRYVLMKRWMVKHRIIASLYSPMTRKDIVVMLAGFELQSSLLRDNTIMAQHFYSTLLFLDFKRLPRQ